MTAKLINFRRREKGATFLHPMEPMPRTAILAAGFQETKLVRVFAEGWCREAEAFRPASLAGPVERLRRVARLGVRLTHAVVVFTYDGQDGVSDADRKLFWDAFGVPVFEQCLGAGNEVLAMECDAHAGVHMVGDFGRLRGDRNSCACGNPAPRLSRRPRVEELVELLA